jgi:hypothetical protein
VGRGRIARTTRRGKLGSGFSPNQPGTNPPVTHGIPLGDLNAAKRIIRAGAAHANMHTSVFAAGEIRGQVLRD